MQFYDYALFCYILVNNYRFDKHLWSQVLVFKPTFKPTVLYKTVSPSCSKKQELSPDIIFYLHTSQKGTHCESLHDTSSKPWLLLS